MSLRVRIGVVVVWVASLLAVGALGRAQSNIAPVVPQTPTIVSGGDVGFRVEGRKGNAAIGVLVVRINGQWLEAQSEIGARRLTAR